MKQFTVPIGVFVLLLAVYLWTMAPGNFWIDSAAFTACNEILGLPHSPSFPLYTFLGRTVHSLLPVNPALASNLYSALAAACGGVILYLILIMLLEPVSLPIRIKQLAAAAGALCAFMTVPVWQSAVRAEVYALQILLSLTLIYMFLKTTREQRPSRKIRFALAAVFFQGLSLANHSLLAVITMPLILALPFFIGPKITKAGFAKMTGIAAIIFSVALSSYLYLPVRSNQNPAINSGQPRTLAATLKAITRTGEDYLPATASPQVDYSARLGRLSGFIFDQTGAFILLGFIAAIYAGVRQRQKVLLVVAALIPIGLASVVWAADFKMLNYDIVAYSGLPLALIIMMAFYGLACLAEKAARRGRIGRLVPAVFILIVIFQFTGNLYAGDLSGTAGPDRMAGIILEEAPQNAVLLVNEDNIVLPLWYYCLARHIRPDVAVISAGALYRPSYRFELLQLYPDLDYPKEFKVYKIDDLGTAVESFCELNRHDRPIMVQFGTPGINASVLTPQGFLFRYDPDREVNVALVKNPAPELFDYIADGATDLLTRDFVARNAFNCGVYYDRIGQAETAYRFFEYAIAADSDNPDYLLRLGIAFLNAGRQQEAVRLLEEAVITGDGCPEATKILNRITDRKYGKL